MGGKGTGRSGTQTGTAQGWDSLSLTVKSIHKSALPPGGHIRALVWEEEYLSGVCVCLSRTLWRPSSGETRGETKTFDHQIGYWNV